MASQAEAADLEARHEAELAAFEVEAAALIAAASKKKRAQITFECGQRRSDLEYRHAQEVEAAEEEEDGGEAAGGGGDDDATVEAAPAPTAAEARRAEAEAEAAAADRRRAKAEKKRGKRADKARAAAEKEKRLAAETVALGERSERAVESAAIDRKLAAEDLRVVEVAADGHCLYRSIAHAVGGGATFAQMREMCAAFLGDHEEDFVPFAVPGAADGAAAFAAYRERVRASAEWGGQVELLALARALGRPIRVFSRDAPVLTMGEGEAGAPLVVAYHRHYYALGEHYNGTRGR